MCDCYTDKCCSCGREIAIHISDFCVGRKTVKVYCPHCIGQVTLTPEQKKAVDKIVEAKRKNQFAEDKAIQYSGGLLFPDVVREDDDEWMGCPVEGGKDGQVVYFICTDPSAYGVCLNG